MEGVVLELVVNGQARQIAEGATVADLVNELGVEVRHVAVEVNLELVPRSAHERHMLREGDRLEVVTLVGGG